MSDQAGACSIVNACEWIVAQIQETFFGDGRRFVYVEHYPETMIGFPGPDFAIVKLKRSRGPGNRSLADASHEGTSADASDQQQVVVVTEEGAESHAIPSAPDLPVWGWVFRVVRREALLVHPLGAGRVGLGVLPGAEVRVWPEGDYTAYAVAGEEGALRLARASQGNSKRVSELIGAVDAVIEAPPDAILDVSTDAPPEDPPGS